MFGLPWFKKEEIPVVSRYAKKLEEKNKMIKILYPIGEKFLSVSNDFEVNPNAETYTVLEVVDYCEMTQEKVVSPVFKDKNGEEFISFAIKLRYSEDLEETLKTLTAEKAYKLLSAIVR